MGFFPMFFPQIKGIIALDIDGTITTNAHEMEQRVIDALSKRAKKGWKFIFLTGRPFEWAFRSLEPLPFPYALAVQNGALLLEMPSKKILSRKYLTKAILPLIEAICREQKTDCVIYSGFENHDWCYFRPTNLSPSILSYVLRRSAFLREKWQPLQNFSDLPVSFFSSIKFFAKEKQAFILSQSIEKNLDLHAPPNRDPFDPDYFVIQATHAEATKGQVLSEFIQFIGFSGPIIAAGDDHNDLTMLQAAQVKIVMANAPPELLNIADVIAPPATQQGIIYGLKEAIKRF
jgi:Cof subfamily protein (haloacid dehalogenase superfamily)